MSHRVAATEETEADVRLTAEWITTAMLVDVREFKRQIEELLRQVVMPPGTTFRFTYECTAARRVPPRVTSDPAQMSAEALDAGAVEEQL
jgi:hypothetical protein